jgi:hypothetical protein
MPSGTAMAKQDPGGLIDRLVNGNGRRLRRRCFPLPAIVVSAALLLGGLPDTPLDGAPLPQSSQSVPPRLGEPPVFPASTATLRALQAAEAGPQDQPLGPALTVTPSDREDSRNFYLAYYQWVAAPPVEWTGDRSSCDAGTTAGGFRDSVSLRVNYFRAMAGVPAQVSFLDAYNAKAQQAALMMSVNNSLSHAPPTTWQCYTADGAEAAGSSDLYLGVYGAEAITGYIRDPGSNNGAVGHRRWILYPQTQNMGTGDIPPSGGSAANALWVFDSHLREARPDTRDEFVAWPPPGYVPYQVVFARWSFSYPSADFRVASVGMTQGAQNVPLVQEAVYNGYGENTIVWVVNGMIDWQSWPRPAADTVYHVTVGNVLIAGTPRSFTYDVIVMDPGSVAPTVGTVSPTRGSAGGGTVINISGTGFVTGPIAVTIGGTAATSVTVTGTTSLTAVTPAHAAGAVDLFVMTPGGSATRTGGFTYVDTPVFTDDPLQAGVTRVKLVHLTELRAAAEALRAGYGLPAVAWTDPLPVAGATVVKAAHLTEVRAALAAVYVAAGRAGPTWNSGTLAGGQTPIAAAQIAEVRAAILAIW